RFGVDNLFNKAPPLTGYNPANTDPLGTGSLIGGNLGTGFYDDNGRRFYLGANIRCWSERLTPSKEGPPLWGALFFVQCVSAEGLSPEPAAAPRPATCSPVWRAPDAEMPHCCLLR